jgi:hypothetical protein
MLAVLVLGLGLAPGRGFYTRPAFLAALLALACALTACLRHERKTPAKGNGGFLWLLSITAVLLSGAGALQGKLLYVERPSWYVVVWVMGIVGFLLVLTFALSAGLGRLPIPWFGARLMALFLTGAVLRVAVLFASPDPLIDVYILLRDAPDYLRQGQNPYAVAYESPYGTERARRYHILEPAEPRPPAYPPLPILLTLPFRLLGWDARGANVVGDLLAALALFLAARGAGNRLTGALLAGTFLFLPQTPFRIEQAWYEPMLAALLGWGLYRAQQGRSRLSCVLLALGVSAKQYGLVLLPVLGRGRRDAWPTLLLALLGVVVVVFLPFLVWGPEDFLSIVLLKHLARPAQFNSLTIQTAAYDLLGVVWPRWLTLLPGGALIGWIVWRTPPGGTVVALWLGAALLVFCLCHTQAYFNYFYLCQYLWLLGIAGSVGSQRSPPVLKTSVQ